MTHQTNMTRSEEEIQSSNPPEVSTDVQNGRSRGFPWTRRTAIIAGTFGFVGLLQGSCYSLLAPFFPLELSSHVPAKVMFCTGIFVDGVCCCLMGSLVLSPPGGTFFGLAIAIRSVESIGLTASFTCIYAVVCAEYPYHIEVALPLTELAFGLGLISGPSIGGVLYQLGGFVLPFVLVGSLLVASSFVAMLIFPDIDTPPEDSTVSMRDVYDWKIFLNLVMVVACFITFGFNEATLAIHLQQADARYICLFGGISMLTCLAVIGPQPFFNFQPTVAIISFSQLLLGIGVASYYIGTFMHSIKHSVDYKGLPNNLSTFALLSGLFSSAFSLGCFLGPVIGGTLLDRFGYGWASTSVFGLQAVVMIILISTLSWDRIHLRRQDMKTPLLEDEAICHM